MCNSVYHYDDEDLQCVCDREGEVATYVCCRRLYNVVYHTKLAGRMFPECTSAHKLGAADA